MAHLVVDASALVEFVRNTPLGSRVATRIIAEGARLHLPQLTGAEVAHALRGLLIGGKIVADDGSRALTDFAGIVARRHPIEPHLPRIWELRNNLTSYDAAYVALAEALEVALVTTDTKFDTPVVTRLIDVEVIG